MKYKNTKTLIVNTIKPEVEILEYKIPSIKISKYNIYEIQKYKCTKTQIQQYIKGKMLKFSHEVQSMMRIPKYY